MILLAIVFLAWGVGGARTGPRRVSPWHHIPLWADDKGGKHDPGTPVHFVCEITQVIPHMIQLPDLIK